MHAKADPVMTSDSSRRCDISIMAALSLAE
jgi:hypothetical protein